MKIAVLAWSLLTADSAWQPDGPLLPIEFAKVSPQGGLIPVLCCETWVLNVRTMWITSTLDDFKQACLDLARREDVAETQVGYVKLNADGAHEERLDSLDGALRDQVLTRIRQWREANKIDVVIWRDDGVHFWRQGEPGYQQALDIGQAKRDALTYLKGLQGKQADAAKKCIRQVPIQVWTAIREHIALELVDWEPEPAFPIATTDDLRFNEWQECRTTIGRLDTILEDLRKVGFSLITGLLTASAFLNFLGVQTTQGVPAPSSDTRAAVFIVVMVLVAALFSIDTYYRVLLSGAVERALDLEAQTTPPIRVTKYLSVNSTRSGISYVILALYLVLLLTAEGLGLLATGGFYLTPVLPTGTWFWVWLAGLVSFALGFVVVFLAYERSKPKPDLPLVIVGLLLPALTVSLATFLLSSTVADLFGVRHWIAATGMFLAIYIQFYWVYTAWRSGMYRQKPTRNWPEGKEKVPAP
jgi:hypothetical protein